MKINIHKTIHKTYDIIDLSKHEYDTIFTGLELMLHRDDLAPNTASEIMTKMKHAN